jgi:hypothetical protein
MGIYLRSYANEGLPPWFWNWVAAFFAIATSRVLLNGIAGEPIAHGRGLRQGDPLSPLLFVLAIDPITQILEEATRIGLLNKLRGRGIMLRTSLYADDAAVFVAPFKVDIQNLAAILHSFREVNGLCTNFSKRQVLPIRCGDIDLEDVLQGIPATRASFPLRYLGLPLLVWCLRRWDFQNLEDKCAGRLPTWNGKLVNTAGRVALVQSVLASQSIYHLTLLSIPPGTMKYINKLERAFVWAAKDSTSGAKCEVNWETICPTETLRWPWHPPLGKVCYDASPKMAMA